MKQVTLTCAESELLPEVRCPQCNRLLFKGRVIEVEIKCPKCHEMLFQQDYEDNWRVCQHCEHHGRLGAE